MSDIQQPAAAPAQPVQPVRPVQPAQPPAYQQPPTYAGPAYVQQPAYSGAPTGELSPKSWLAALLLSIFLGELGIDRFYLGKIGTGILKLITFGGFGIWWLVDIILIIAGAMRDQQGRLVKYQG